MRPRHHTIVGDQYHRRKAAHGGGVRWYLRAKVPFDLREVVGKSEIRKTLGTTDYAVAVQKVRIESVAVDACFAAARAKDHDGTAARVATEADLIALVKHAFVETERSNQDAHLRASSDDYPEIIENLQDDSGALYAPGDDEQHYQWLQTHAQKLLIQHGLAIDPNSLAYRRFLHLLLQAEREGVRRELRRYEDQETGEDHFDSFFAGISASTEPASVAPPLSVDGLIKLYKADPNRSGLRDITHGAYEFVFKIIREVIGDDKAVKAVTRQDCREVQEILIALPPNSTKRFPGQTFAAITTLAKRDGLVALDAKTQTNHLNNMSALFNWAVEEGHISENPARHLKAPKASKNRKSRLPFSEAQLQAIFSAPLYTGCVDDENGYAVPGVEHPRRGRFWVPLIALWSGMRLNECAQLEVSDIRKQEGIDVVVIEEDESRNKRVKTSAGERILPIHPELLKIGLLEHVKQMQENGETRLFPELPLGATGYYSNPFSKWFGRFLHKVDARDGKTSFHSFRHSFRDALRAAKVSEEVARVLGGWEPPGSSDAHYGTGFRMPILKKELNKVRYPGLDLTHLYIKAAKASAREK